MNPEVIKRFEQAPRGQGHRLELRLDAGDDGQAPVGQPVRPDLPDGRLRGPPEPAGNAAAARPRRAPQQRRHLRLLRRSLVRQELGPHRALRDVHDRHRVARGQGRRPHRLVERPHQRGAPRATSSCSTTTRRRSGRPTCSTASPLNTIDPAELEKTKETLELQKDVPARLLDATPRRTWSAARPGSTTPGTATSSTPATSPSSRRPCASRPARRGSRSARTAWRSRSTRAIPVRRRCSSTGCSTPRSRRENISWFGYPMPIKGTEAAFAELAGGRPGDPDHDGGARQRPAVPRAPARRASMAWDRVWTEVKT